MFLKYLRFKDYNKAFFYFEKIYLNSQKFDNPDGNLYLYLLGLITIVPEKYLDHLKNLKFIDMRVDYNDIRYSKISLQNKFRGAVIDQRFTTAINKISQLLHSNSMPHLSGIVTIELLMQAKNVQFKRKEAVYELIEKKDYQGLYNFYENLQNIQNLGLNDKYLFALVSDLLKIRQTGIIPCCNKYLCGD